MAKLKQEIKWWIKMFVYTVCMCAFQTAAIMWLSKKGEGLMGGCKTTAHPPPSKSTSWVWLGFQFKRTKERQSWPDGNISAHAQWNDTLWPERGASGCAMWSELFNEVWFPISTHFLPFVDRKSKWLQANDYKFIPSKFCFFFLVVPNTF